jgi:hypothetical protein
LHTPAKALLSVFRPRELFDTDSSIFCLSSDELKPTDSENELTSCKVKVKSLASVEVEKLFESISEQKQRLAFLSYHHRNQSVHIEVLVAEIDHESAVSESFFWDFKR